MDTQSIANYYNQYEVRQSKVGVNKRHISIFNYLLRFGIDKSSSVLEIGCGVGTLTSLIVEYVTEGVVVAIDLSDESITKAKKNLEKHSNIELIAGDILEIEISNKFDFIVLPDVIEHIPIELHTKLFSKISSLVNKEAVIAINIPNPYYLEWCHKYRPELLQIIDQPVYLDQLSSDVYSAGLIIDFLETYSIWYSEGDYQMIRIRKHRTWNKLTEIKFHPLPNSNILSKIRSFLTKIIKHK